jgi:hypothetical protein
MNPKLDPKQKSKSSGISLEPDLIKRGKVFAEKNGFGSLSNLTRFLLTQELNRSEGEPSYKLQERGNEIADTLMRPSANSAGGSSTHQTVNYRQGGRRK